MSRLSPFTDDDVANALKQDAKERSARYQSIGLQAFMPTKSRRPTVKPNTRFLQNILRETDSHNASLLAKEKREAREKEKQLTKDRDDRLDPRGSRRSREEDRHAEDKRRKRGRREYEADLQETGQEYGRLSRSGSETRTSSPYNAEKRNKERRHERKERRDRSQSNGDANDVHSRRRRRRGSRSRDFKTRPRRRRSTSSNDRYYPRKEVGEYRPSRSSRDRKHRSASSSASHSPSPKRHRRKSDQTEQSRPRKHSSDSATTTTQPDHVKSSSKDALDKPLDYSKDDSDPLEAFVGPLPPPAGPKPRGRGAVRAAANAIDDHFASTYDPSADVSLESENEAEGEDWENALEAFRDRMKWKKTGAARLREAGFGEEEVKRWESGIVAGKGREKDESDVKWGRKGEGREWDRGKVVDDEDGDVRLEAQWGRLKGT